MACATMFLHMGAYTLGASYINVPVRRILAIELEKKTLIAGIRRRVLKAIILNIDYALSLSLSYNM